MMLVFWMRRDWRNHQLLGIWVAMPALVRRLFLEIESHNLLCKSGSGLALWSLRWPHCYPRISCSEANFRPSWSTLLPIRVLQSSAALPTQKGVIRSGGICFWLFGPAGSKQRRRFRRDDTPRYRILPSARSGSFAGALPGGLRNAWRCLLRLLGDLAKLKSARRRLALERVGRSVRVQT